MFLMIVDMFSRHLCMLHVAVKAINLQFPDLEVGEGAAVARMQAKLRGWSVRHNINEAANRAKMRKLLRKYWMKRNRAIFTMWREMSDLQVEIRRCCWRPVAMLCSLFSS